MAGPEPPRIVALTGPPSRAAMVAAAEQLSECVTAAVGHSWPVRLRIEERDGAVPPGAILVASLLDDMISGEELSAIAARWRERIARCRTAGHERILIANLFRHVAGDPDAAERIRRLNLLAIELSRELDVEIVDVDRLLSLLGGRTIGSDYRSDSEAAARLTGHAITAAILAGDWSDHLDPDIQQQAAKLHGGLRDVRRLLDRYVRVAA